MAPAARTRSGYPFADPSVNCTCSAYWQDVTDQRAGDSMRERLIIISARTQTASHATVEIESYARIFAVPRRAAG